MPPRSAKTTTLQLDGDNMQVANLCGPLDENLTAIAKALNADIGRSGHRITITAEDPQKVADIIETFHNRARHQDLTIDDIQLGLIEMRSSLHKGAPDLSDARLAEPASRPEEPAHHASLRVPAEPIPSHVFREDFMLKTKRTDLRPRTPTQKHYIYNIMHHDITFGVGPAGTGKTWLAVACAVDALERDNIQRLVLTRPAVEAGEKLGFLPGDLAQKVDPYLRPLYDALYELMGYDKVQKLFERQIIEIAPLAYMRGRTLNHAFVILDEAQNTSPEQMKMFLTRIGFGSRAVITGDPSQVDLPKGQKSGLRNALHILKNVKGVSSTVFSSKDVVRHPVVARIIEAYEKAQNDA